MRFFLFITIFLDNFVMIDLRVIYLLHVSCDGVSLRLLSLWDYRFYCLESLGTYFPKYFFVPTFFSPMGTLTTHLLACLKLLHNSLMLFNYSGFFLCGVCLFVWFGLDCFHCYAIKLINLVVVIQSLSHIWFCNPMDCSIRGFPVLHYLLELAQIHVHWVGDAI